MKNSTQNICFTSKEKIFSNSFIIKFFKSILLFILIYLLLPANIYSQSVIWQKTYRGGGDMNDIYGSDICPLNDGGFLVICNKDYPKAVFIIRLNSYGNILDSNYIPNMTSECCAPTTDNGCIFIGYELPPASSLSAVKINSSGQTVWKKNYSDTQPSQIFKIIRTKDNKFVCCGNTNYFSGFALKIDANGNIIWKQTYLAVFLRDYKWLSESNNSGYILSGVIIDSPSAPSEGLITKIDTSGTVVWEKRYKFIILTINNLNPNYLLSIYDLDTAVYQHDNAGYKKIDENGNIITGKLFFAPTNYTIYNSDCKVATPNKYLFLNSIEKKLYPWDTSKAYSFITDSSGNVLSNYFYDCYPYTYLSKGYNLTNGGFVFVGASNTNTPNIFSAYVIRADSNLYAPPVGIINGNQIIPDKYSIIETYPNPFNSQIIIKYKIAETGNYNLGIFDILGKEIKEIINGKINKGYYLNTVVFSNFPSGIYFVKLQGEKTNIVKKIILLK